MFYIIISLFLIFIASRIHKSPSEYNGVSKGFLIASYLIILALYILKDNTIFPDLDNYEILFNNSKKVIWANVKELQNYLITDKYELGWCVFTKAISDYFDYFLSLIVVYSIIYLGLVFSVLKKYSNYLFFAIILFLLMRFYNSCFILRQNLAAAICIASVPFIINKKPIRFVFFILTASLFHQSALVFSVMYFLFDVKINKWYALAVISISAILYISAITIFSSLISIFEYYQTYVSDERTSEGSNYTSFILSIIPLLFVFGVYKNKKIDKINRLFIHAMVISSVISLMKIGMPGTVGRLALYFSYFNLLAIPNACVRIHNESLRILSIIVFFVLYFALFCTTFHYGFQIIIL